METPEYDEKQELPSPWEWIILTVFSAMIMGFGWIAYLLIADAPRFWDFGQLPDAPAESIYSSYTPPRQRMPRRQMAPLPEAMPLPVAVPKGGRK